MPQVLVIEDNPINLELVTEILEGEGYEVVSAPTAAEGIHVALEALPDLILMDVQLPGMTGYDATRRLKEDPRTAGIPVVALTAHAMRGEEGRACDAGCAAFLTKPVDAPQLRGVLRTLLCPQGTGDAPKVEGAASRG